MKRYILLSLTLLLGFVHLTAQELADVKTKADSAYVQEEFETAVKLYAEIAKEQPSADICYNLGCAYYRMDDIAHSLLWLERAYRLDPSDDDISFNLEHVRTKTIDRITPRHEFVLMTLFRRAANLCSLQTWTMLSIGIFAFALLALAFYFLSDVVALRKACFFGGILLLLLSVFTNVCAQHQRTLTDNHSAGIVMSSAVTVKSTPAESGNDLFVLHEGTKVEIRDASLKDWCEVTIADGKVGWIPRKSFEVI